MSKIRNKKPKLPPTPNLRLISREAKNQRLSILCGCVAVVMFSTGMNPYSSMNPGTMPAYSSMDPRFPFVGMNPTEQI